MGRGRRASQGRARQGSRIVEAIQVASPLRLGLERLAQAFAEAKARIGAAQLHAITMTGELADTFSSRAEGVGTLAALAARELGPTEVLLYAGRAGFIAPQDAPRHVEDIASANWFASASLAARVVRTALFVDIGSTTTDLVPVVDGTVVARGYTDAERLAAGELVYTGLVRSFVMAVAERAPFIGRWSPLINENFATMADVHRILGQLPDGVDQMATAEAGKTIEASRAQLARMVGCDVDHAGRQRGVLAQWFASGSSHHHEGRAGSVIGGSADRRAGLGAVSAICSCRRSRGASGGSIVHS
jgi:probable H4MPT-linked C1 transfer pathway protein